ncbi:MAG: hypothetical protein ACYDH6_13565 [Acidimicrobiales bacterium]
MRESDPQPGAYDDKAAEVAKLQAEHEARVAGLDGHLSEATRWRERRRARSAIRRERLRFMGELAALRSGATGTVWHE